MGYSWEPSCERRSSKRDSPKGKIKNIQFRDHKDGAPKASTLHKLSGKTANISYIPIFAFSILRRFFRFFESTWNIADRLQFGEISNDSSSSIKPSNEISWSTNRLGLESYLQEYFGKILKKLRETNYQQSQKADEISFL